MKTAKLNKSATWELIQEAITDVVNNTSTLKKGTEETIEAELINALAAIIAPKQGGGTSTKVNAEGLVYCNYFEMYLEANDFNKKLTKPNKETGERTEVYKANSKAAEVILRTIKTRKAAFTKMITEGFREGTITGAEMSQHLDNLDAAMQPKFKFDDVSQVPSIETILEMVGA